MQFKTVKDLLENDNVHVYETYENELGLELQPYDKEITLQDAKSFLKFIKENKEDILDHFEIESFVISISDHNIDGLDESNSNLIFKDSEVYSNY